MSVPVIAFFNNKGGVGKTSLVYHVAYMAAEQGHRVVAADLDPQGHLTTRFLDEERLAELWPESSHAATICGAVMRVKQKSKEIGAPVLERISDRLTLIPGDMSFAEFEDDFSQAWSGCLDHDEQAFRVISSLWRTIQHETELHRGDVAFVDLGPNLGAINRAALIASDFVVIPIVPDMFSVQGLRPLGSAIRSWRSEWKERLARAPNSTSPLPGGEMRPLGYVVMQGAVRRERPSRFHGTWLNRIPAAYSTYVLGSEAPAAEQVTDDPHCLAILKHYRSLMPMAQEAGKPVFLLNVADGALGAHTYAVKDAYADFQRLFLDILKRAGIR